MRPLVVALIALALPVAPLVSVNAQVSVGINIGINVPTFPDLVPVPGYPVYYDPFVDSNYFFYDGQYWVYDNDYWYTSDWYNGPWQIVEPDYVPMFILRVPVRYYRRPPMYFGGWHADRAPRWEEHWGHNWEDHHRDWNHWDRRSAPPPAPLPVYQRQYSGDRYPRPDEQPAIRNQHYQYKPREESVRQIRQNNTQRNRNIDEPVNQPANRPGDQQRSEVPRPESQTQPLPEQPLKVERPSQRPAKQINAPKPAEELRRPPVKRPDAPPPVRARPMPPQQSAPTQTRQEQRQPPMQRPQRREMPSQREEPRRGPPPAAEPEQHRPSKPQRDAKKPPHEDE